MVCSIQLMEQNLVSISSRQNAEVAMIEVLVLKY